MLCFTTGMDSSPGGKRKYFLPAWTKKAEEMLPLLLAQYYLSRSALPREIWLPLPIEDPDTMEQALSQHAASRVLVRIPKTGRKGRSHPFGQPQCAGGGGTCYFGGRACQQKRWGCWLG